MKVSDVESRVEKAPGRRVRSGEKIATSKL